MNLVRYFPRWLRALYARQKIRSYGAEFEAFAKRYFDPDFYLSNNPDVAKVDQDAITHWICHGLREGRIFSPEVSIRLVSFDAQIDPSLTYLTVGASLLEVRNRGGLPTPVLNQILAQGEHDPILFGPGALALPNLPVRTIGKPKIDLNRLFACVDAKPKAIFVIPLLVIGGAEKYAADIYRVLQSRGVGRILVIVTDQKEKDAAGWKKLSIIEPFRDANVLFWQDICGDHSKTGLLASLLVYLEPELIVVTYSGICLQTIASHGKRLSQKSRIFCTFFSLGMNGLGAPYGITFARETAPFATSVTDNQVTAVILNRRLGLLGNPVAVIPPSIDVVSRRIFESRLADRMAKMADGTVHNWVWVSRIDKAKGIDVLRSLAVMRRKDTFDLFGPLFTSLDQLGLNLPNIRHRGILKDVARADFSNYQGYLFTSPLEGMPNVVLEMSQHAIPLIISAAGGLPETFDSDSALIIPNGHNAIGSARAFQSACDRLNLMSPAAKAEMMTKAYEAVTKRHSTEQFSARVCEVFGV